MIKIVFSIVLLLISLLSVFSAPTYHLWLLAILVTEFPLIFVVISAFLVVWGFEIEKIQLVASVIAFVAMLLFSNPVIRAWCLFKKISTEIPVISSGDTSCNFSFSNLFKGKYTRISVSRKLKYVSYADFALTLDFFPSAIKGKRPCVIIVHGGSWKSGDNSQLPELNSVLAFEGYHVAAINYRLAPKYKSPYPVQDVKAAIAYLKQHADNLGIDATQFVLLGRSAGAQIALLAAYTQNDPSIKGVIDFYGPADMVWGYSLPANPLVMDSRKVMEDYLGGKYLEVPENYKKSSPIEFVSKLSPPTLIIHGKKDVLVAYEHSIRLQHKLNKYGVKNYFLSLPWATHGFDYNINGPGGQLSTYAVKQFLLNILVLDKMKDHQDHLTEIR